jgi:hypothetical protein
MIKSLCASDIVDSKVQVEGWIEKLFPGSVFA